MEPWRNIWRTGIAPLLSSSSLLAIQHALEDDDPHLAQGCIVFPKPVPSCWDLPPLALGLFAYCGMEGEGLSTIFEVSDFHDRLMIAVDQRLGDPGATREFLNWFDGVPRQVIRAELLPEIAMELSGRHEKAVALSRDWDANEISYEYNS